ncbi:MAG: nuclease-related domain-containing protein [Acholeplasmataceae bacterium]
MDYLYYGGSALGIILIIFIIVKLTKKKSDSNELFVNIGESNPDKNYYVLSDISFHDGIRNANISQLIINQSGIHAISEFPYQGKISGNIDQDMWTYEDKGITDTFKNPVQVINNIKLSIDKVLKKDLPVYSYIVFPEKAELPRNRKQMDLLFVDELKTEINKNMKSKKKISVSDVSNTFEIFNEIEKR